jgi:UDP-N-acetylmuramate--alanine ligase
MGQPNRVHFLGIGGSGASAVAHIAEAQGFEVTGCDLHPFNEFTKDFKRETLFEGHSPNHLYYHPKVMEGFVASSMPGNDHPIDILAVSPAIYSLDPNNEELKAAKELGIETLTWQEFMGKYLEEDKYVIAISGTHGKTTTTAMVAQVLEDANLDPTVELGTIIPKWGKNFRIGKSRFFITEADEFNNNFLVSNPDITVLTTLEMDHPEFFKDFDEYKKSFLKFLNQTKGKIFANFQDPGVREVMEVYQKAKDNPNHPEIIDYSKTEINFPLKVWGEYNKLNATAAFQVALSLGVDPTILRNSLMQFTPTQRRLEYLGKLRTADIYTDFGHHPTEIKVTVEALKEKFKDRRVILIYQPHMFSRTKALFNNFVQVLKNLPIDQVMVMDIYPSREVDTGLVSSKELVEAIKKPTVAYIGGIEEAEKFINLGIRGNDVILFMGAGDVDSLARRLVQK